jgi:iron complex transport system substrate-binding protein
MINSGRLLLTILTLMAAFVLTGCRKQKAVTAGDMRIISMAPALTRLVMELGAGDKLVGVTDSCRYKTDASGDAIITMVESNRAVRVGGYDSVNLEKILGTAPTHLVGMDSISMESRRLLESSLDDCEISWFLHPRMVEDIPALIESVAEVTECSIRGRQLVDLFNAELSGTVSRVDVVPGDQKPVVLLEIYYPPFITAGKNTFLYDMIVTAGGYPALQLEEDWPAVSLEDIIAADPDVLVKTHDSSANELDRLLRASSEGRVFTPSSIDLFLQPGTGTASAIRELYDFLYPRQE